MANYPFKMEPSIFAAFSGPNFCYWKMSVEEYIFDKERDLYLALKGVDYKPSHMSKKDWQLLDKKALEIIRSGLPQTIASNILQETTTKGAMDVLDRLYGTPSALDKMYLMRKLFNMRLSDSGLIHNHLNEFEANVSHLSTMDVKFEDEVTALLLLSSLPESWKDAVMTVSDPESGPSKLKYDDVVGAIVNEDLRRRSLREGKSSSSSSGITQEKKQMDKVKRAASQVSVGFVRGLDFEGQSKEAWMVSNQPRH